MRLLNRGSDVCRKVDGLRSWQFEEKEGDYEKMCEEKEGVMRNAMTTRAPGGANKTCSINQFAKMFHTLFGLLNTNLKLLG